MLLNSKTTVQLKKTEIKSILKLKSTHYKYDINSQLLWFKKNIKKKDIHIMLKNKSKLIGYNVLRHINVSFNQNIKKNKKLILFDTLIIDKKYRKQNLSKLIVDKSNKIIKRKKKIGILFCKKKLKNFYKKFQWKVLKIKNTNYLNLKEKKLIIMIFKNKNNFKTKEINFQI